MNRLLTALIALALLAGCSHDNRQKLEYGTILRYQNGMILPMKDQPDGSQTDWCIELIFDENQVVMRSPRALHSCYFSFAYDNPATKAKDITIVDLDFMDVVSGKYVYALSKAWFPAREVLEHTFQTAVYYAPEDVSLPMKEIKTEDGTMQFPDFTGFCFIFNKKETRTYFRPLF